MSKAIQLAKIIRDYHHMNHALEKVDCILAFGSHDSRTAIRAAQLYNEGYAPYVLCSGGTGRHTESLQETTEAEIFASILLEQGVPKNKIIIENKSTNSAENVLFSMKILKDRGICFDKLIVVHKPYMERRAYATLKKHFPEQKLLLSSLPVSINEYVNDKITLDFLINLIVGDVQRIKLYPAKGFQIPQDIPDEVNDAMIKLINLGYDKELIN